MTRAPRVAARALLALAASALLALAAASPALAAPPYDLAVDGAAGKLAATPSAGGSTLALQAKRSGTSVVFTPAAAIVPTGCTTSLTATTCPDAMLATSLRMQAPVLSVTIDGVSTTTLTLTATGGDGDSMLVEGPVSPETGSIGTLALTPGAGNDEIGVAGGVGALTVSGADDGDDDYAIGATGLGGTLDAGPGNDVVRSASPSLTLSGGAGSDTLIGPGTLNGGADDDVLEPTTAGQTVAGDAGTDRVSYELVTTPLTIAMQNASDLTVNGSGTIVTGVERVEGSSAGDTLIGQGGHDELFGGEGDDTIDGRGGGDILDGGPGFNTVSYASAAAGVNVDLAAGTGSLSGIDTLRSFRGVITGAGNDIVNGTNADESFSLGAGNDQVNGGPGNDSIDGGPGNDLLRGGLGSDVLNGGPDVDTATYDERGPSEPVSVTLATPGGDGAAGENDTLSAIENVTGGASNDTLAGDDGPNSLIGGPGLNTIDGLGGDDVIQGGDQRDVISGGPGRDQLFGNGDDDSINAFDGEADLVDCGSSLDDDAQVDATDQVTGCEYSRRGDVPVPVDADGDGFVAGAGFDCNDADPAINPGAKDIVGDGIDQNCDGLDEPVPYVEFGLTQGFKDRTAQGARVAKLVVTRIPSSYSVRVSCSNPLPKNKTRCPFTTKTLKPKGKATQVGLTGLFKNRRLPPLTTIELRVTAAGFNGKVRRFQIRSAGVPSDKTLCLIAPKKTPTKCPPEEL
jgi:Ca2+-binding RTX toxin-like protein